MDDTVAGYVDLVRIGEGAAGVVYRARQEEFARDVAIKVLSGTFDDASWRRFERECRAVGALSGHPGIVTVYEAGRVASGRPFITMEYCARGSLEDVLARDGTMPWRDVVAIGVRLAAALEAVHRAGVLHRDIKPANVLVSEFDEPKLADFGIADVEDGVRTETGALAVTAAYAAPELLEDGEATVATDVYALCALLFALLVGHPPFGSLGDQSIGRLVRRIMDEPIPPIDRTVAPEQLALVLTHGLAKAPADRPDSAGQLARQLQAVQASLGEPVTPVNLPADGSEARPGKRAGRATATRRVAGAPTRWLRRRKLGRGDGVAPRSSSVRWLSLALVGALLACGALLVAVRFRANDGDGVGSAVRVAFSDEFDRTSSGWSSGREGDSADTAYEDGLYRVTALGQRRVAFSATPLSGTIGARLQRLANSTVEADVHITNGDPLVGVACRYRSADNSYYYGAVDGNGYWGIFKSTGGKHRLLSGESNAVLQTEGNFAKVGLDCLDLEDGSVGLVLRSGEVRLGTARDTDHQIRHGGPGVVVRNRGDATAGSSEFDNFEATGRTQVRAP